jgi:valyl-tRNA synthetase
VLETGTAPHSAVMQSTAEFDLVLHLPKSKEDDQRKRREKDCDQLTKNIENSERQLGDEVFLSKAPPHVVEAIRKKLEVYRAQFQKLNCQP